jgi:hypothetical protein
MDLAPGLPPVTVVNGACNKEARRSDPYGKHQVTAEDAHDETDENAREEAVDDGSDSGVCEERLPTTM